MNTITIEAALLVLLCKTIARLIAKYNVEVGKKVVSEEVILTVLQSIHGGEITIGDLRGEHNTGANLRAEFGALGFNVPLVWANLIAQFLKEWTPSSPQCDQRHDVCGLYGVDFAGKQLRWLERGNLCTLCQHGTVQVGEGQQTHRWNWITGAMVPVSETVHRATGFDFPLEEGILRMGVDPTMLKLLDTNTVSVGQFLAYLMHTQHGLPVQKDPHSVQASVRTGGTLVSFPERTLYAHVMKAKEMKGKESGEQSETRGGGTQGKMSALQLKGFKAALLSAFPRRAALHSMVRFELDENLESIAGGNGLDEIIDSLLAHYESSSELFKLLKAARASNNTNDALKTFAAQFGL